MLDVEENLRLVALDKRNQVDTGLPYHAWHTSVVEPAVALAAALFSEPLVSAAAADPAFPAEAAPDALADQAFAQRMDLVQH